MKNIFEKDFWTNAGVAFAQIIVYLLFAWLLRQLFSADRRISQTIKQLKRGSLIVSNHQSVFDPFVILAHLPPDVFLRTIPIRFPTDHEYYAYLRPLSAVGSYDIGSGGRGRMLGLLLTRQYLADGQSIMIFPEGKICNREERIEFQQGIKFLTDISRNVVFVRMDGFHRSEWLKNFGKKRRKLVFSEVQYYNGRQEDADALRERIDNLPVM